jgi:2-dehydro-3-deoxygalactonokinase
MGSASNGNWIAAACRGGDLRIWSMCDATVLDGITVSVTAATWGDDILGRVENAFDATSGPIVISGAPGVAPVAAPAKPLDLPLTTLANAGRVPICALPGICQQSPLAHMQTAATTIAGFIALNPGWDGVVCIPGPRTHWVQISAAEVVSFQSFLTLSTYEALRRSPQISLDAQSDWNLDELTGAVGDVMSRPERLTARIAEIQAAVELTQLTPALARSRLMGALTGAELAAAKPYWLGQNVALLADGAEQVVYAAALAQLHVPVTQADAMRMTQEGLIRGWRRLEPGR